jgi:hypothetical protein
MLAHKAFQMIWGIGNGRARVVTKDKQNYEFSK